LDAAGIFGCVDAADGGDAYGGAGVAEVGAVESVQGLKAELQRVAFTRELEEAGDHEVYVLTTGSDDEVAAGI